MELVFMGFLVGVILCMASTWAMRKVWKHQIDFMKNTNVLEDLDLATTDQLLDQFRSRPNNSYILLLPMKTNDEQGLKVECNSVTPYDSVSLMHLATSLMVRELRSRGMSVPDLPPMNDEKELP